jgi:hypothetical protein
MKPSWNSSQKMDGDACVESCLKYAWFVLRVGKKGFHTVSSVIDSHAFEGMLTSGNCRE